MTKAERKRLVAAWKVEVNPLRKIAYEIVLRMLPAEVVLPHSPKLARHVAGVWAKMGSDANNRDLMLFNAWDAALDATLEANKKGGPGVRVSELIAGPTLATVKRELKRLYPKHNISRNVADYSLRRSYGRLRLSLRKGKPGPRELTRNRAHFFRSHVPDS